MPEELQKFFKLLHLGLTGGKAVPGMVLPDEWRFIFSFARLHQVQAVIYDAVSDLLDQECPDAALASRWKEDVSLIEERYRRARAVFDVQKKAWEAHGINAVMMKGLTMAELYPNPSRRVQGDIDWWFLTEADFSRGLELARNNGVTLVTDSDGDVHYTLGGVVIEHHRQGYEYEGKVGVLVYLQEHILKHAMVFGVGLRQICDYALARKEYMETLDGAEYSSLLERKGLVKWNALLDASIGIMGIMPEIFKLNTSVPDKDSMSLASIVMEDGNFGRTKGKLSRALSFLKRMPLFLRYVPGIYKKRLVSLCSGHLKRLF